VIQVSKELIFSWNLQVTVTVEFQDNIIYFIYSNGYKKGSF